MKDIKSILIGVFATTCLFLFMGQTSNEREVGRYQISTTYGDYGTSIYETIIDTKTGNIISRERLSPKGYRK